MGARVEKSAKSCCKIDEPLREMNPIMVEARLRLLYNDFMKTSLDHPSDENNDVLRGQSAPGPRMHWACCLGILNPLAALVTPSASSDPAVEISLLPNDVSGNTSMLSAYYLSFYE